MSRPNPPCPKCGVKLWSMGKRPPGTKEDSRPNYQSTSMYYCNECDEVYRNTIEHVKANSL